MLLPESSTVPLPACTSPPDTKLPANVTLPLPVLLKVPSPSTRALLTDRLPAPVLVNEVAVIVPPPSATVPLVLLTVTELAKTPALVTVITPAVAASPKLTSSNDTKAMLLEVPSCTQFVLVVFQF